MLVRCSLEHAFDVFTSRIDQWWPRSHRKLEGSTLTLATEVGGLFLERAPDGEQHKMGEVLACERPSFIRYSWFPGSITGPTEVEVRFTAQEGGTLVEITHREGEGADAFEQRIALFKKSWPLVLGAYQELASA